MRKADTSIYLVDNKQGGMDSGWADVYCAELKVAGFIKLLLVPACGSCWGRLLIGGSENTITFLP